MALDRPTVTPDEVLRYTKPTETFLCSMAANVHGIEFLKFTIRDMEANNTVFEVARERGSMPAPGTLTPEMEMAARTIRYNFAPEFLDYKTIGSTLVFSVGPEPVNGLRMIERHYFHDRLVQSYDFNFGFCIPNSTNSWESIYALPPIDPALKAEMLAEPYATKSDSFYFVNNKLVMHNKAEYAYKQ